MGAEKRIEFALVLCENLVKFGLVTRELFSHFVPVKFFWQKLVYLTDDLRTYLTDLSQIFSFDRYECEHN